MSARPLPPSGYRPPAVEDYDEDNSTSDDGDAVDAFDASKTPANVGSKRSDPTIVKQKKYATSDSGYSSLTTTTASSSRSKTQGQVPEAPESSSSSLKKKVASLIKKPAKDTKESKDPKPAPQIDRRMSRKNDIPNLRLRSVESREEAAQVRRAAPVRVESQRSPAYTSGMPGAFPPSPTAATRPPLSAGVPIPRAVPRPRTNSTTYYYRPVSYGGSGSLPTASYQIVQPQPQQQQLQHQPVHVEQYRAVQPVYVNPSTSYAVAPDQFGGQTPYVPTPTSSSPATAAGFGFGPASSQQYYPPPPPPQTQPPNWTPGPYGYPSTAQQPGISSRRTSVNAPIDYGTLGMQYPPPPQIHYAQTQHYGGEIQRRYSQTVGPSTEGIYRPPPMAPPPVPAPGPQAHPSQTPLDEGVFMEDYEDYYRMPPPPRPSSSHPTRPPMPHARTTSAAAVHPSHRRSLEYQPAISPRKQSFESRPPSRPGMVQRYSSNSGSSTRAQYGPVEPASPVRRKHAQSLYGQADLEKISSAEAYQTAKTGGYQTNVTSKDLPPLGRRTTKNSETSSRGSSSRDGSDGKHNKRLSRQSLDKQRHSYDREGYTVNIGEGVSVNTQGGSLTIKHSRDGEGGMQLSFGGANNAGTGRPPSAATKPPAREPSRVRSGGNKYIEGSSSSSKSREKADYEVSRRRRSSSMQPTVKPDDLTGPLKRLDLQRTRSRQSRSSSRSGRVYK